MSDSDYEGGGFVKDDPDLKRKRKRTPATKPFTRSGANSRTTRRSTRLGSINRNVSYVNLDDSADDEIEKDDEDYYTASNNEDNEDDEEILILEKSSTPVLGSSSNPIAWSEESDLSDPPADTGDAGDVSDIPLDALPKRKRASTTKPKTKAKNGKPATKKKKKDEKPKLTPFQKRTNRLYEHHQDLITVFDDLKNLEPIKVEKAPQPQGMTIKLLPFQLEGVNWLVKQEEGKFGGGILADEMGMGKTIQTIGLIMHNRENGPTLVVAPTVALMQWRSEIDQHTGGKLKVNIFHGANRAKTAKELNQYDVILTTYAVLESVYRKERYGFKRGGRNLKEKSPLHAIEFYRVVLDEAHNIKDRQSNTAKSANNLKTEKKWCLSGTPLQNRIGEMYSLIRFLDIYPFCNYFCTKCPCKSKEWNFPDWRTCGHCGHSPMVHTNFFNHFMLKNIQKFGYEGEGLDCFERIQILLNKIMLRRTKVEKADDLGLPPRIEEIRRDFFNEEERDLYQSLYSDSRRQFNDYVAEGVVLNNYANIFTLITRMRQMADHPDLVLKRLKNGANSTKMLVNGGTIVCQLCDDEAEEPIESKCHHRFCRLCISEYVEGFDGDQSKLECPICHIALSIDLEGPAIEVDRALAEKGSIVNRIRMGGEWRSSTKIEALMEELYKLRSDRQTIKSIVFSQFTSMLDLVEWRLKRAGFETVKLQGSMSPSQRDSTINYFMNTPSCEVFLVSLKAGGVALNLVEASQVFILDQWWNPATLSQASDRVHRFGQKRPIRIVHLCIEDSIESRIIELQEKKSAMIDATINHDDQALNRLSSTDMQFLFNN